VPAHVQTKTEIRALLEALGVRPRKRFGQNFLIDGNLMRRLAVAAEIGPEDAVLEVGAGTGGLTDLLVEAAGRVVAVEIDRALAGLLRERFAGRDNVTLIEGDVLHSKNRLASPVVEAVNRAAASVSGRTVLAANLPYSVATPLLMNLLHELPVVSRLCFTVQRDVAEKIEAVPRTKAYGPLSIALQAATRIRRVAQVPASAFWPQPNVESSMLRLDVDRRHLAGPAEVARFTALVRDAFSHRRKTLKYNLARCLDEAALAAVGEAFDLSRRPEDLSVDEWLTLARRTVLAM
jgi:16S rRNA (adenine1518-N6/adenine1519-N6)-dimethyltransferase